MAYDRNLWHLHFVFKNRKYNVSWKSFFFLIIILFFKLILLNVFFFDLFKVNIQSYHQLLKTKNISIQNLHHLAQCGSLNSPCDDFVFVIMLSLYTAPH